MQSTHDELYYPNGEEQFQEGSSQERGHIYEASGSSVPDELILGSNTIHEFSATNGLVEPCPEAQQALDGSHSSLLPVGTANELFSDHLTVQSLLFPNGCANWEQLALLMGGWSYAESRHGGREVSPSGTCGVEGCGQGSTQILVASRATKRSPAGKVLGIVGVCSTHTECNVPGSDGQGQENKNLRWSLAKRCSFSYNCPRWASRQASSGTGQQCSLHYFRPPQKFLWGPYQEVEARSVEMREMRFEANKWGGETLKGVQAAKRGHRVWVASLEYSICAAEDCESKSTKFLTACYPFPIGRVGSVYGVCSEHYKTPQSFKLDGLLDFECATHCGSHGQNLERFCNRWATHNGGTSCAYHCTAPETDF